MLGHVIVLFVCVYSYMFRSSRPYMRTSYAAAARAQMPVCKRKETLGTQVLYFGMCFVYSLICCPALTSMHDVYDDHMYGEILVYGVSVYRIVYGVPLPMFGNVC